MKKNNLILKLGNQPVSNRFKKRKNDKTKCINLTLVQENDSGLIKLLKPTNPKYLKPLVSWLTYNEPEEHLDMVVEDIQKNFLNDKKANIGGISFKDDTTLNRFKSKGHKVWRIDNKKDLDIDDNLGVESIQSALNHKTANKILSKYNAADVLVVRHIWEHTYDQKKLASALKIMIKKEGIILIELPDCTKLLKSKDYTMIWEEHLFYYTLKTIIPSLSKFDFQVVYKKWVNYPNEPSIIIGVRVSKNNIIKISDTNRSNQLLLGANYKQSFSINKKYLIKIFKKQTNDKKSIAIFGAGHLSMAFISFFKIEKYISIIFDDNPNKQGLYMPNTKIKIVSSESIKAYKNLLILLSVNLTNEHKIKKKIENTNNNKLEIKSIFPLSKNSIFNVK